MLTSVVVSFAEQHENMSNIIFLPTLNETNVITDTAILHTGTNNIINSENNKDIVADSIINIAGEKCDFISTVNETLKAKCLSCTIIIIFLNIKKENLWKNGLRCNRSSKDFLTNNFLQDVNNFLRNLNDV